MCCLGFLALACGIPAQDIKAKKSLKEGLIRWKHQAIIPSALFNNNDEIDCTTYTNELRNIDKIESTNDKARLDDQSRQDKLTELFKKIDVEIIFI